ncbi:thiamine biosynthesis lipoprotein [Georgenia soli]|uniref:FAD:protein FMN transferase n=1 Tax=Georgenia soli TaxID=638953 RepID=A0A2A9EJ25_9MICO|nr:FAD:protein FMN transferase [Georgenia soli]PFG38596.1 thiamine biosynthesis lipoprotein [Georgenia soli]
MTALAAPEAGALRTRAWHRTVMGMPVSIHLRAPDLPAGAERSVAAVYAELRRLDGMFSTYRPDSAVSLLADGVLTPEQCPPEVSEVLDLCELARELTAGAIDARRPLPDGGSRVDPTGLVKGWAVERAAAPLHDLPGTDFYVNAGGDLLCHVADEGRPAWRVGIEDPQRPDRLRAVITMRDGGVATSGAARRGHHIWDPRAGGAADGPASVTVSGPTLLWADVLATATYVSGAGSARWAATAGYQVDVVAHDGGLLRTCPVLGPTDGRTPPGL